MSDSHNAASIQVLPADVIDQIAAGEVVERPSHLVKELVENSLDAGAGRIDVDYSQGGRRVKVSDDGKGMDPAELPLALQRFATSKIRLSDDLWRLSTFGFRGEALASLAAVSHLTITSRRAGDETAHRLISKFGVRSPVEAVGGAPGTSVLVEDLFGNVPARLKFMKTEAGEHGQIRATLKALALSRPDVEFRIHENGKLFAFYPPVGSARERAEQVLEISPLYEGEGGREGVKARAVFAPPGEVAKTSRNIWLFAQGRWVQDRGMQAAVTEAYRNLLMHGEYPIAAVWVTCDPSEIDVNIHPTKSQVKFRDPSLAFRAVAASLRSSLEKAPWIPKPAVTPPPAGTALEMIPEAPVENARFQDPQLEATVFAQKDFHAFRDPVIRAVEAASERAAEAARTPPVTASTRDLPNYALKRPSPPTPAAPGPVAESAGGYWSSLQVLGQANLTYILCQNEKSLVLVDQHAAHERVAFERLMNGWKGGRIDVQEFLFPFSVEMAPDKVEALMSAADDFARLGVKLETLGPGTVGVKAGPALLKDSVYAAALDKTAQEIADRGGSFNFEKIIGDLCATMACHSVVRAGQALSPEQMRTLLREMDEFPLSSFCPHGRAVSVEFPFTRLEKEFGRLV